MILSLLCEHRRDLWPAAIVRGADLSNSEAKRMYGQSFNINVSPRTESTKKTLYIPPSLPFKGTGADFSN